MKTVKAVPISRENFSRFGTYGSFLDTTGADNLGGDAVVFYRDMCILPLRDATPMGFSPLKVKKHDKIVISDSEYHNYCCEVMLALDDDVILHVAPASGGSYNADTVEAFIVPKGTMTIINPGVWHGAAYPVHHDTTVMIGLPERTYATDCTVVPFDGGEQVEITF
jgi:ureidoglycolate lyase